MIKQRILGFIAITTGVIAPVVMEGDATLSLFFIPLGLYMMFTKEYILYESEG